MAANHIKEIKREFIDLSIPMPWGHIVGRWYGNRKVRPILALHGWLDNMGTWNTLIPLLPEHLGILCIDLPGHGLSPKLPKGIVYHAVDYVCVILRIMEVYEWKKVSILAHSMSSMLSFIFASLYPDRLDMLISIDVVRTRYRDPSTQLEFIRNNIEKYLVEDDRLQLAAQMEPPAYTQDQLLQVMFEGSGKSVALENCQHILERNITKSVKYPDKYYFSRDGRVKFYFEFTTSPPFAAELARRIHDVPYCVIKGSQSNFIDEQSAEVIEILKGKNPHFELHEVEGTHHVHLNNPQGVAAIINPFINRHRPPLIETWSLNDVIVSETMEEWSIKTKKRKSKL
ncbi:probable serine hydrolase isoform X1 [Calliphora vicina]|uniref:probable serine hydrolase isoform X1 n=2 Tax=Calliphora vicina TaxID=7373 RepID=UPI00325C15CF